jgi:hypothetical protein
MHDMILQHRRDRRNNKESTPTRLEDTHVAVNGI